MVKLVFTSTIYTDLCAEQTVQFVCTMKPKPVSG